ncbi:MAG: flagellin, partial [Oscillospiraceae bacterium]|nr:flagellin [Oscillospiraceae bacterium]
MVVQHNLTALNANRYLGINNTKLSKSLEKLSSGYAINRAGDNAAGLAVSEKMRSQIAGMTQGAKNAQDGISMIQTFEGALTETDSILQRMKTLADQSANGTYQSEVDRDAIELEFKQLNDELNQIADTDYNGVVMLNGGVMADGTPVNNVNVESYKPIIKYHQYGTGDNSLIYSQSVNGSMTTAGT